MIDVAAVFRIQAIFHCYEKGVIVNLEHVIKSILIQGIGFMARDKYLVAHREIKNNLVFFERFFCKQSESLYRASTALNLWRNK